MAKIERYTKRDTWKSSEFADKRKIRRPDPDRMGVKWQTTYYARKLRQQHSADFVVTVNIDELINYAVMMCRQTKNGRSRLLKGIVDARRTNHKTEELEPEVHPIPAGYEEVPE